MYSKKGGRCARVCLFLLAIKDILFPSVGWRRFSKGGLMTDLEKTGEGREKHATT